MNYNPPLQLSSVRFKQNKFEVIRDDLADGGTAGRGLVKLMSKTQNVEYVYACHNNCHMQVSLAYAAYLTGNTCTLIISDMEPHPFTERADVLYGAKIIKVKDGYLKVLQARALEYVNSDKVLLPFYLGETYIRCAIREISQHINISPRRLWVIDCSGSLLNILYHIFPDTHFCIVQVGKPNKNIIESRSTVYVSADKFCDKSEFTPPYPSLSFYDSKMWVFIMQYGEDGDYIWNSGCDVD